MFGKMDGSKLQSDVRKSKKKQVKDEMDRIRQAEKKRRRLEKALATSAAIRSELEKKKQKKKEEQQRLDEEGAAIAEAVALHVLLGEDSDDSRNVILNKNEGSNSWGDNLGMFPYNGISRYWVDGIGWVSNPNHQYEPHTEWTVSSESVGARDVHPRYLDEECWNNDGGISAAGLIAAQAVSSLRICEDNNDMDKYVLKPMSRC